jgi:adenosine deaminase
MRPKANKTEKNMTITLEHARALPKVISHEHLDCSLRPATILELADKLGVKIPPQFLNAWRAAGSDPGKRAAAVELYQASLTQYASASLDNYLKAIVKSVLPVMQTQDHLYRITRERIEDAVADGIIAMKLRFAPQLHRNNGLTLQQVMDPVQQAVSESPFPVRLIVCALRHENGRMAHQLANLTIKNPYATTFDLAASETLFPGVLKWWVPQAKRVAAAGKQVTCHLGETQVITDEDHDLLDSIGCTELGHAIKGDPRDKLCTVCVTSNLVTHQVPDAASHPIDAMYRAGRRITIDTDGTLFTRCTASSEYKLLADTFGWGNRHFLRCNLHALEHFPVDAVTKTEILDQLLAAYCPE